MTIAPGTEGPTASRTTSKERDFLFIGSVAALVIALLERPMVAATLEQRFATAPGSALATARSILWASSVLSPLFFVLAVLVTAAVLWSIGQFLEEDPRFRIVLNACAIAQLVRVLAGLLVMVMLNVHLLPSGWVELSMWMGSSYHPGDGMLESVLRALENPLAWVWCIALASAIHGQLRWRPSSVVAAALLLFALQAVVTAIRVQQTFLPS